MKPETQRRVENLLFSMQQTLEALDQLKRHDRFESKKVNGGINKLRNAIDEAFAGMFRSSSEKGTNYYINLMDWLKISSSTFEKFDKLSEESKLKYLNALANFNTINLREK